MKNLILIVLFLTLQLYVYGQNQHLIIGLKDNGICLGNSSNNNGIRFNLIDKNVESINGVNICGQTSTQKSNGISLGLYLSIDSISNGVQIAGLGAGCDKLNGLSISPGITFHDKINGIALSGLSTYFGEANGIQLSLFGSTPFDFLFSKSINGVVIGGITVYCSEKVNGAIISSLLSYSESVNGISIGCINMTDELHGFQFGLINYAKNNRKIFRLIPIINFNLRKNSR